ncbi:MAG: threonine/serine dehydratase [Terriglobales bacterium]|jgi:threonine dehydratase
MMSNNGSESEWVDLITEAMQRIDGMAVRTPVALVDADEHWPSTARVFFKLEHLQKTGAFKLRGATNKIFSLSAKEAAAGVITSSTGNHGLAVATAASVKGIDAEVVVSAQVVEAKLKAIQACGARISHAGENPLHAEVAARKAAGESGRTYIPPYNDRLVVAGQGTLGVELVEQIPQLDAVFVAVGGGGLIGGIGAYLHAVSPGIEVVGCWPENSRVLYESLKAGKVIDFPEQYTVSESTAGGVEPGSITLPLCQKVVGRRVLVTEQEILAATRWAHRKGWPVEAAAGVAIAAFFKTAELFKDKTVVIVLCGKNLTPQVERLLQ